jgi:hypothetical protein
MPCDFDGTASHWMLITELGATRHIGPFAKVTRMSASAQLQTFSPRDGSAATIKKETAACFVVDASVVEFGSRFWTNRSIQRSVIAATAVGSLVCRCWHGLCFRPRASPSKGSLSPTRRRRADVVRSADHAGRASSLLMALWTEWEWCKSGLRLSKIQRHLRPKCRCKSPSALTG